MSQCSRTMYLRGCISFHRSTPSRRNLQRCLDHSCRRRMSARTSWRYPSRMRGFLSRSSTGCVPLECHLVPILMILSLDMKAFRVARLDTKLRQIAFSVLRRLCGRIGHLPGSYLLSTKFDLSGMPCASGGFADVRMGVFKGKDVSVKSLRVSEVDDKAKICKVGKHVALSSSGITHTSYSSSVKRWPYGRTCPIQTSSLSSGFLTPSRMGGSLWFPNGWTMVMLWGTFVETLAITLSLWVAISAYPVVIH